ncbi:3-deoxy-manno-octulosonate cytidylyltransferase (CMP-KDO synthetase) [Solimonas aquatica]|uniref:3-deoxy-manno-octulosonate cytidylyltransferase n=1 Tax=Solimonas aquatica TaxID=489703 RepID=A0A1H9CK29_9GAMM|nr:3-deoxy-manno-octulosonate cytidylyltransferase [Solimonas aquatica]SEQ01421.1 3-deoxy-manno-octulosonate cytidylyltransferase (CMP-KDO synthetase) [Solimonas aquatica]
MSATPAFKIVIPARLGSTRLPRKVLREIAGKSVVQHVWESARRAGAEEVVIATDSDEVLQACRAFGADVRLTATTHNSGTDRANQIAREAGWAASTIVVNLQGDEPLMPPAVLRQAASLLAEDPQADIASLCHEVHSLEEWLNPNVVKLVMDRRGYALYFSRAPIPWRRDGATREHPQLPQGLAYRHIGLYAYRVSALAEFSALPPAPLEDCEALEQLRALTHGLRIRMGMVDRPPPRGIDTEEDLQAVARLLGGS